MKLTLLLLVCCGVCFAGGHQPCRTSDLSGTYAFLANGAVLVPGAPISGPFMRIGSFTADGKGGIHFATLALYNSVNFGLESFGGTYSVTSDCALDMHVAVPAPVFANAEFKGQIALGGDDLAFMLVNTDGPPAISTVVGFGQVRNPKSCSNETIGGSWRMEINGTSNIPPTPGVPGTPYRQVGQFVNDGKGGLLASFVTSTNGVISNDSGAGTYKVNSDCTFDLNYKLGSTPYSIRGSVIDEDNAFLGLNLPGIQATIPPFGQVTITGAVATGKMVRQTETARNGHGHDD